MNLGLFSAHGHASLCGLYAVGDAEKAIDSQLAKWNKEFRDDGPATPTGEEAIWRSEVKRLKSEVEVLKIASKGLKTEVSNAGYKVVARILPITLDEVNERFKNIQVSVTRLTDEDMADSPLSGHRSTFHVCRELQKSGQDFVQQGEKFLKYSDINAANRVTHEYRTSCKAPHLFQCYDQYNLPSSAGVKVLVNRKMLVEHALVGRPEAP
jgi:hypothetical protein